MFVILFSYAYGVNNNTTYDCTKIFQDKKNQLLLRLDQIDEQQQALSALKSATARLLKKKSALLQVQKRNIDLKLKLIREKEKAVAQMLNKDKQILADIKSAVMGKISQTYSKMKADAAAGVLSDMNATVAVSILRKLDPKVIGKIFTQMSPQKASQLTIMLTKEK